MPDTGSMVIIYEGLSVKDEIVNSYVNQWLKMDEFGVIHHVLNRYCSGCPELRCHNNEVTAQTLTREAGDTVDH